MAEFSKFVRVDLNAGVRNVPVEGGFFRRDALANRLGVIVSKDHEPVTLTGIIKGFVKYPPHDPPATGTDVTIYSFNGTIDPEDPSKAYLDLPAEAYYYNGTITVAIRNDVGDKKTVLATFTGYVSDSTDGTDGIPPHSLPDDIDQFISYLSQLETDIANVQTAAAQAIRVNITQSKTDRVITVQTTGRTEAEDRTTTITEPTATLSKEQDGPYTLTVTDATGTTSMPIPDPAAEVKKKVNRTSVTSIKTAYSDDGVVTVDDALDEPAKLTLSLEPKQNLHGYTHPWVGGAGKNLVTLAGMDMDKTASGITLSTNGSELTIKGTATAEVQTNATLASQYVQMPMGPFPAGTYTIKATGFEWQNANDRLLINARYSDNSNVENAYSKRIGGNNSGAITFTATQEFKFGLFMALQSGSTFDCTVQVQFEAGSTATDYAPYSNICPITGFDMVNVTRMGKNLYAEALRDDNHSISVNGVYQFDSAGSATRLISVKGMNQIRWGVETYAVTRGRRLHAYDQYGNWLRQLDFFNESRDGNSLRVVSIDADVVYVRISMSVHDVYAFVYTDLSITDFIKDEGAVTSLPISASAGSTIYGGTVTVNEDGSGTVVVDRAIKYVEDLADSAFTSVVSSDGVTRFWIYLSSFACYGHTLISDFLKEAEEVNLPPVGCFRTISTYLSSINCAMPSSLVGTTLESVRSYFKTNKNHTDNYFVAFLITPLTYSLTAAQIQTLLGTNHVWTDSGCEFTLDYRTDKYGKLDEVYSAFPEASAGPAEVVTITDGADDIPVKSLSIAIEPKQDLHGYDHPWVGGAGKNLCPGAVRDETAFGLTTTNLGDGSFKLTGTYDRTQATTYFDLDKAFDLPAGSYVLSGTPDGLSEYGIYLRAHNGNTVLASGNNSFTLSESATVTVRMYVPVAASGKALPAAGITFYPMVRKSTETDSSFAPYSNICPISGWDAVEVTRTGKNLLGIYGWKWHTDGNFTQQVTARSSILWAVTPGDTLYFSKKTLFESVSANLMVRRFDSKKRYIGSDQGMPYNVLSAMYTIPNGTYYVGLTQFYDANINTDELQLPYESMAVVGSTPTAYEPYRSTTLPISLSRAGTVYGGTLDVGTGKIVVNTAFVQFNGGFQAANNSGKLVFFHEQCAPLDCPAVKCNLYEADPDMPASATQSATSHPKIMLSQRITSAGITGTRFMVYDTTFATLADFNAFLATTPMQVVYDLATPITYQLSPRELTTLLGTNHIWSDAGQVSLTYRQSPKLIINDLIRRIEALEEGG